MSPLAFNHVIPDVWPFSMRPSSALILPWNRKFPFALKTDENALTVRKLMPDL